MTTRICVLCGGVGAARMLRAMASVVDPARLDAVVNTGDDTVMHGLHISPDIDTVIYTVANAIDPERGWGLVDETWRAVDALGRYAATRPATSMAGATWFGLGDADLATHMYRTGRLAEGARLTTVTDEIRRAWEVAVRVLPMSDEPSPTEVTLGGDHAGQRVAFQDYFVRLRHEVPVTDIHLGAVDVSATPEVCDAIDNAELVIIAPSNPLVSIGPVMAVNGVRERLEQRRDTVVALSPLVGGAALKGPAADMMRDAGLRSDAAGVATLYAPVAGTMVIDTVDADLAGDVRAAGCASVVTDTVMTDPQVAARLAQVCVDAVVNRR